MLKKQEFIETIEDCYTYYVLILKMSENLFWNADVSFLMTVYENMSAYDDYVAYTMQEG